VGGRGGVAVRGLGLCALFSLEAQTTQFALKNWDELLSTVATFQAIRRDRGCAGRRAGALDVSQVGVWGGLHCSAAESERAELKAWLQTVCSTKKQMKGRQKRGTRRDSIKSFYTRDCQACNPPTYTLLPVDGRVVSGENVAHRDVEVAQLGGGLDNIQSGRVSGKKVASCDVEVELGG